jgi:hypothetical protein
MVPTSGQLGYASQPFASLFATFHAHRIRLDVAGYIVAQLTVLVVAPARDMSRLCRTAGKVSPDSDICCKSGTGSR